MAATIDLLVTLAVCAFVGAVLILSLLDSTLSSGTPVGWTSLGWGTSAAEPPPFASSFGWTVIWVVWNVSQTLLAVVWVLVARVDYTPALPPFLVAAALPCAGVAFVTSQHVLATPDEAHCMLIAVLLLIAVLKVRAIGGPAALKDDVRLIGKAVSTWRQGGSCGKLWLWLWVKRRI
jgi:ABC-type sugar transport system permease subunit